MKYVSNRVKDLKVGISNYSEEKFSLDIVGIVTAGSYRTGSSNLHSDGADLKNLNVTGVSTFGGNVAIGTDNVYDPVGASNTTILAVGILTANTIYSTVYGQFTGGSVVANNIVGSALSVSGISSLGSVQISSGIITAVSGIVTYFGDGSNLTGTGSTADIKTNSLQVLGISTFTDDIKANGNIIGDNATNISGISSVTATKFFGALTGNVTGDVTGDLTGTADTALTAATVTGNSQPNITSLGSLTGLNVVGIATVGGDIKANGNIVGDNATNISGINSVTATNFFGNASSSTTATLSLFSFMTNNSTADETVFPVFVDGTTSSEQLEVDSGFTYNPSSGILSATKFLGNLDGTLETAAQPNVTSLGTLTSLSVNGNVSIGGTLTYDDVTNIDSVGLITARQGIHVGAGLSVVGISTFNDDVRFVGAAGTIFFDKSGNVLEFSDDTKLKLGSASNDLQIYHDSSDNNSYITNNQNGSDLYVRSWGTNKELYLQAKGNVEINVDETERALLAKQNGVLELYHQGIERLETTGYGIKITGSLLSTTEVIFGCAAV